MSERPVTFTMPTEESAPATAAAFFCNLISGNGAQTNAQKYFPKIHQWQLRQTAFWIPA
jgi:hypothetical protein